MKKVERLYNQYVPEHYSINITIAKDKKSFKGSVVISGQKNGRPSERITFHQKDLKIDNVRVIHSDKKNNSEELKVARVVLQNKRDEVRVHFDQILYPGKYQISMNFSGIITKNMDGIYPSFFKEDGIKKQLIATQFESHHAREAFPCIDEPEAKATFELTLNHSSTEIALSNTPISNEVVEDGRTTTTFESTPIMSTYLLAFVIGEMTFQEKISKNGVKIRTYATKYQTEHTDFALETAVKCMDFYEEYYDIPFPLKKCDFVALPDFASGAMENWGLITFREQTLLCDISNTSLGTKQYVALVVAHELTHQWFGNLVTMRWWTDLWLNEGFASWMEYLAVDSLYPEWQVWTQFAVDEQQLALKVDGLEHTHPIEVTVKHPDEIRTIFDAISYQKGASAIHMLQHYLGAEDFKNGLRNYLKKHAYSNTDTIDLWQSLEDTTKKPVKEFMGAWTSTSGFPLIQVVAFSDHLSISQSRYVTNPKSESRKDKNIWPIPLLTDDLDRLTISKKINNVQFVKKEPFTKLNIGQTGFYRVNYSHDIQQSQLRALDAGIFDSIDRMGLLADSFEVTKAGYQHVTEYLELLKHYSHEDSLAVWDIIASSVGSIRSVLSVNDEDNTLRDLMKPFVRELVQMQLDRLGWDAKPGDTHLDKLLRPMIIGMAVSADNEEELAKALQLYDQKISGENHVNPDLRGIVYSAAARKGGQKEFDQLYDLYKKTDSSDEKLSITAAMTSFKQSELHAKVLELMVSDNIRRQDTSYWLAYSFMNRHARKASWQWMQNNWDWLKDNLGTDMSFSRMPIYAARTFSDQKLINEYVEFFADKLSPTIERSYNQGLEMAQTATEWRIRDSKIAIDWFKSQS